MGSDYTCLCSGLFPRCLWSRLGKQRQGALWGGPGVPAASGVRDEARLQRRAGILPAQGTGLAASKRFTLCLPLRTRPTACEGATRPPALRPVGTAAGESRQENAGTLAAAVAVMGDPRPQPGAVLSSVSVRDSEAGSRASLQTE